MGTGNTNAQASLRFEKLNSVAGIVLFPNTMYLVESVDTNLLEIYVSNKEGTSYRRIADEPTILQSYITFSDNPPEFPCKTLLWYDTVNMAMFVKYEIGEFATWVELISSAPIPEFAGTGTASTMARSDHWHETIRLGKSEW